MRVCTESCLGSERPGLLGLLGLLSDYQVCRHFPAVLHDLVHKCKYELKAWIRVPVVLLSGDNLRQVVHTHVPLPPSSIIPANGRYCHAAGKVTVGLASHCPCVTDFSGLCTYGKGNEYPACTLLTGYGTLCLFA